MLYNLGNGRAPNNKKATFILDEDQKADSDSSPPL